MKLELRMSQAEKKLEKILKEMEAINIPIGYFSRPKMPKPSAPDVGLESAEIMKTSESDT